MNHFLRRVLACGVLLLVGCADPINLENFHRIQPGMTVKEVETILGGRRPDSYQTIKTWRGSNSKTITVEIDDRGLVVNKTHDGLGSPATEK